MFLSFVIRKSNVSLLLGILGCKVTENGANNEYNRIKFFQVENSGTCFFVCKK